jgi:hypothetical protein
VVISAASRFTVESRRAKRDVEFALRTDEIPGVRGGKEPGVVVEGQSVGLGADAGAKLLERGRELGEILETRLRRQIDVPAGGDRRLLSYPPGPLSPQSNRFR